MMNNNSVLSHAWLCTCSVLQITKEYFLKTILSDYINDIKGHFYDCFLTLLKYALCNNVKLEVNFKIHLCTFKYTVFMF